MNGASLDISAEKRAHLKQLFPTVFTETKNDQDELVESIDFEKLKAELGTISDLFESRRERYGMDWPGKKDALSLIQNQSHATLKPCREESVNFDETENLFIEGDNLEVLKLLQKSYYGKIKMIYIDPPYNTGKEFIYPDNFNEGLDTYLEYAGLINGDGKKFSTNTANEGRFHTKWLNMMYPRLYLARNLLRDDGVIFISIDDNEVSNLRKLCDDIFGEENFVANVVWQKRKGGGNDSARIAVDHEYIGCWTKNKDAHDEKWRIPYEEEYLKRYKEEDAIGKYYWDTLSRDGLQSPIIYNVECPDGSIIERGKWQIAPSTFLDKKKNSEIKFVKNKNEGWTVLYKVRQPSGRAFRSIINMVTNSDAAKEMDVLFSADIFDNPKPSALVSKLLMLGADKDSIILDFFSGSCTTAHSVLDLNKQDNGNRKFIMVQLPEPCAEDSEAFKAGYKTIADIGKKRIRRVIKKINHGRQEEHEKGEEKNKQPSLFDTDSSPSSVSLLKNPDLGFRVLKLDRSNFKQWEKLDTNATPEEIGKQLERHLFHINPESTQEDLLFELLLKAGFMPTEKMEIRTIAGKKVFSIAENALLISLEDTVTIELINDVAKAEPMQFICLDSAFRGNDQLKANAVQTFIARNIQKEKYNQIVFRTV